MLWLSIGTWGEISQFLKVNMGNQLAYIRPSDRGSYSGLSMIARIGQYILL
jgi:hypothetical protein